MVSKGVLNKTVGIFSGITRKNLKLEDAPEPMTDGTTIGVPHDSPVAYELLEQELARVVFRSDALVKQSFVEDYVGRMTALSRKHNTPIHEQNVAQLVGGVFDVLEAHRVLTLWSRLYPGSASRILQVQQYSSAVALDSQTQRGTPPSVLSGLLAASHGVDYDLGPLEHLRPYLEEALEKVSRRSAKATLTVSRWLVSALINQLIRDALGLPPPSPGKGSGKGTGQGQGGSGTAGGNNTGNPQSEPQDPEQDPERQDPQQSPPSGQSEQPEDSNDPGDTDRPMDGTQERDDQSTDGEKPDAPKDQEQPQAPPPPKQESQEQRQDPWHPPPVQSLPREKLQALNDLANNKGGALPEQSRSSVGDVQMPPMSSPAAQDAAKDTAKDAASVNTNDPNALDEQLDDASKEAEKEIEELEKAIQSQVNNDDWITKDLEDAVVFQDVRSTDLPIASLASTWLLSEADERAVKRLRLLFGQVKGRMERSLDNDGTEVDVQAYIERLVTRDDRPVFRAEIRGRGFRCMLLLDRSGTMTGDKTKQAERAYRILHAALNFPYVHLRVWGFNSLDFGKTNIYRFEKGMPSFATPKSPVAGHTPLHTAIDLAVKELGHGTEHKVLFVLSDGFPEHHNREGAAYGRLQLQELVRAACVRASTAGVRVVGTFIGELERIQVETTRGVRQESESTAIVVPSVEPERLAHMFGPPKNWRVLDPRKLGDEMVSLVSDTFLAFLRSG